ncbi:MAG TPA: HIT family protein [Candidatus Nanoarchaeia archaeon]|nr:HIT family protein [Candidatus Nanoarchaeia archaeon]
MNCEYCELRKSAVLYEDKDVAVIIKDMAVTPGQITVLPKQHFTILEMVPNELVEKCFIVANKVSIAIFEGLGSQGTNLVVQNGLSAGQTVPHFAIEVVPRKEEDGLNLQWQPKPLSEPELESLLSQLSEVKVDLNEKAEAKEKQEIKVKDEKTEMIVEKEGKNNYLLKSIRRTP